MYAAISRQSVLGRPDAQLHEVLTEGFLQLQNGVIVLDVEAVVGLIRTEEPRLRDVGLLDSGPAELLHELLLLLRSVAPCPDDLFTLLALPPFLVLSSALPQFLLQVTTDAQLFYALREKVTDI